MKRITVLFLSLVIMLTSLSFGISAEAKAQPIAPKDKGAKLIFAAWGDSQVSHYLKEREPYLISAAQDIKNNSACTVDALVLAGDITENGIDREWQWVYNDLKDCGAANFIMATGNHDIRMHEYKTAKKSFVGLTNKLNKHAGSDLRINALHYSYTLGGCKFIVLGSDKIELEEATFGKKQLQWLESELQSVKKKYVPTFVILHQPLKNTHGLPDTWDSPIKQAGSVGTQSDKLQQILNRHANVILITGHLHTGFGQYTYQRIGNIYSVNLPSVAIDNEDGEYNENGIGYMVEVYNNRVLFRARNFDKGVYVPRYDICVNLYIKSAKLSKKRYVYDGKVKTPQVTVKDAYGKTVSKKYYTVAYPKGRKKPGKYQVKITFRGKYKKAKPITRTFKIVKKQG